MNIFQSKIDPDSKTATAQIAELEEKLNLSKALQDITNRIHAATNLKQILVDLRDDILDLFNAHSITIYVADRTKKEIYSMFLAGSELKEIRLPIDNRSIAGYVANNRKFVNIANAYNNSELQDISPELHFDSSWDKKSGFKTTQVLAVPILREDILMGVVQILNRKDGGASPKKIKISSRKWPMFLEPLFTIRKGSDKKESLSLIIC